MSCYPRRSVDENTPCMQDIFSKKTYPKIDDIGRLHIINALDNGHNKNELAREYGVTIQMISYVYRQKDILLKKYKQKLNSVKGMKFLNLDATLFDWFKSELQDGNAIFEDDLQNKAIETLNSTSSEELEQLQDWLSDFQERHNIVKPVMKMEYDVKSSNEWLQLMEGYHENDIYLGGTCALQHKLDLDSFTNASKDNEFVSVFFAVNSTGTDRKQLLVVGSETLQDDIRCISSQYFINTAQPLVSWSCIFDYLKKWNSELEMNHRHVAIVLDIPDFYLKQVQLDNITIFQSTTINFMEKALEKIVYCFKLHYRKIQISKSLTAARDEKPMSTYLDMISLAWYSLSPMYVRRLFHPPMEGSLLLQESEDDIEEETVPLSEWCKNSNLGIDLNVYSNIDEFVNVDDDIKSLAQENNYKNECVEADLMENSMICTSGIDAFQAMKRLLSYMQGESAEKSTMESARNLENHLELEALVEMHSFVSENGMNNDTLDDE